MSAKGLYWGGAELIVPGRDRVRLGTTDHAPLLLAVFISAFLTLFCDDKLLVMINCGN